MGVARLIDRWSQGVAYCFPTVVELICGDFFLCKTRWGELNSRQKGQMWTGIIGWVLFIVLAVLFTTASELKDNANYRW
jgi:hypothetical protein